jgi:hypothetical protein
MAEQGPEYTHRSARRKGRKAPPAKTCGGWAKFDALAVGEDSKLTAF